jgi:hypothetical protein
MNINYQTIFFNIKTLHVEICMGLKVSWQSYPTLSFSFRKTNCVLYKTSVTKYNIQNVPCNFKSRPYSTTKEYNNEYILFFVSFHLNHSSLCFYLKNKDLNKPEFEKRKWQGRITLSRHWSTFKITGYILYIVFCYACFVKYTISFSPSYIWIENPYTCFEN